MQTQLVKQVVWLLDEDLVGKILSSYSNDFNTQIRFMDGGNPLLISSHKKSGMDLSEVKTYEELRS